MLFETTRYRAIARHQNWANWKPSDCRFKLVIKQITSCLDASGGSSEHLMFHDLTLRLRKSVYIIFLADRAVRNFFGFATEECRYFLLVRFASGWKQCTKHSPPVTIRRGKSFPLASERRKWVSQTSSRPSFRSVVSCLGTQLMETFLYCSTLWMMLCAEPRLILNFTATSSTVTQCFPVSIMQLQR